MGSQVPKHLLKVAGKSILEHTVSKFLQTPKVSQIIIATSKSYMDEIRDVFSDFPDNIDLRIVEGGSERQYSINNALKEVLSDIPLVAIHDAVRPFIRPELIEDCCAVAEKEGGAILAVPAKDTIKRVSKEKVIVETPDRSALWQAQTPQVFKKELLFKAYQSAIDDGFVGTDDASLVERIGEKVMIVSGDRENLKITYPVDLKIAEFMFGESNE
jgi:2-C-methyl-D-erythritol 4-phosphate cytidylyltransferase